MRTTTRARHVVFFADENGRAIDPEDTNILEVGKEDERGWVALRRSGPESSVENAAMLVRLKLDTTFLSGWPCLPPIILRLCLGPT